jgi:hypothetical protein
VIYLFFDRLGIWWAGRRARLRRAGKPQPVEP